MAPLPSVLQNMKKSLWFHEFGPKVLTNFGCRKLKLHTLNYFNDYTAKCAIIFLKSKIQVIKPKNLSLKEIKSYDMMNTHHDAER